MRVNFARKVRCSLGTLLGAVLLTSFVSHKERAERKTLFRPLRDSKEIPAANSYMRSCRITVKPQKTRVGHHIGSERVAQKINQNLANCDERELQVFSTWLAGNRVMRPDYRVEIRLACGFRKPYQVKPTVTPVPPCPGSIGMMISELGFSLCR
jgi:hypothetical protein